MPTEEEQASIAMIGHNVHAVAINRMVRVCGELSKKWYHDPATGQRRPFNVPEKLMLIVSEIAEALEGHRKNLQDDHLPDRKMLEVELGDGVIRIFDLAAQLELDLGGAIVEKLIYNVTRADHKPEARMAEGGKQY